MSTFLQLCQKVRKECGIAGTGPSSVLNQLGEIDRVVTWVSTAWNDIQDLHTEWRWLWTSTSQALIAGGRIYDPTADWGLSVHEWDYDSVKLYRTSTGIGDERFLIFMPWDEFKQYYGWGNVTIQKPTVFTKRPDDKIMFNFQLDDSYTLHADYWATPSVLVNNTDVPAMPARFHDVIVWKACIYYAEYEEAGITLASMMRRYKAMLAKLERIELPLLQLGGPLA